MERLVTTNGTETKNTENAKEVEIFSKDYVESILRKLLSEKVKSINNLKLTPAGNELILDGEITASKFLITTRINLEDAHIVNIGNSIGLKEGYKLSATVAEDTVKDFFTKHLGSIGKITKEYIEREKGKRVEKIEIVNGELKVTFTTPKPVEKVVATPPTPHVVPEAVTIEPEAVTPEVPPATENVKGETVYEDESTYDEKEAKVEELRKKIKKIYKGGVVDVSALAKAQARDVADHRMTESKEDRSGNWLKRTAKRIWKHNIAQEWYRNREIERVRKEILESGNLYAGETEGASIKDYEKAKEAIVERFTSEYEDEMLKKEEKESKGSVTDEKAKEAIKNLIKEFAGDPSMSERAFEEEQNRILAHSNPEYAEKGKMYASNLLDIAKEIRKSVAHGEKLAELDFDVEITLGQARESLNTEAKHNAFEKIVEKTQNSKLGKYLFNEPASVALAAGLYSAGNFLGVKFLSSKVAKWGTFGATALLAGGIAASKEAARLNRERAQHMRESAKGATFEEDDMKRRQEMEENRYETRSAREIIQNLEKDLAKISTGKVNEADLDAVLVNLSDLEARIKLGDEKKLDLVTYSKFSEVEKERMTLDLLRAKIKVAVRKGIGEGRIEFAKEGNFDTYLEKLVSVQSGESGYLSKDIEQKNKIFKSMKRRKVAGTFVKTVLIGGAVGVAFQEVRSAFQSETDGIVEGAINYFKGEGGSGASKATALEGLRRYIAGVEAGRLPFGNGHEMMLGNTHLQLPEGVSINPNEDGTYSILRGEDVISNHTNLEFAQNGDLTDASKALLAKENIVTDFSQTAVDSSSTEKITRSAQEYTNKHPELTTKIRREVWMDNDTPMHRDSSGRLIGADKNELKLQWGGNNGTGIDEDKNYVFNVEHMTDDGSYHKGLSVAAKEQLKAGKLEVLLSVTKGLQHTVFKVPIDINGNAIIDPKSPIGEMMFETKNGRAIFNGQFAEIGHSTGMAEDGAEKMRILSTHVGTGRPGEIVDTVTSTKSTTTPNIKFDVPADWTPEVPPFIPIPFRRPLERGNNKEIVYDHEQSQQEVNPIEYYFGGSGFESSADQKERYEKERSKTLKENPNATLDEFLEIKNYFKKQKKDYIKDLESIAQEIGVMEEECRLSVCIPVAGHQEGNAIYKTLENYSSQTVASNKFEIVLFVNWPEKDTKGNPIEPDSTLQEIERFKKDHPDMKIRVCKKILPIKDTKIGHIRKILNDAVLLRQLNRGENAPELFMVSNDADNKGLASQYIENFISKFDKNKEVDSMIGQLDWDPGSYIRNPLIHIGTRLFQYNNAQSRAKGWHFDSSGANFALRASIYAGVGGYSDNLGGGEDTDLGAKIKYARAGAKDKKPIAYAGGRVSRLYTSSRRAEMAMKEHGLAPIEQWDKGFSAFDDAVRKVDWESKGGEINYKDRKEVKKLISALEKVINRTIKKTEIWGMSTADANLKRSLGWLGIKYKITGKHSIKITDATKLIKGLEQYQKEGLKILKRKTALVKKVEKAIKKPSKK